MSHWIHKKKFNGNINESRMIHVRISNRKSQNMAAAISTFVKAPQQEPECSVGRREKGILYIWVAFI